MLDSYIIYLPKSKKSSSVANSSINRFKNILNLDVKKWEGVDRYDVWQKFIDSDFKVNARNRFGAGYIDAELGVFFSHYSLWKKCLELNKNILILEHDAWPLFKFDLNILEEFNGDVLNIGKPNWGSIYNNSHPSEWINKPKGIVKREVCNKEHNIYKIWTSEPGYCHCDTMWLFGAHSYLLTPVGASKLIKAIKVGILPADIYIRQEIVTIHDLLPHPIEQLSGFTFTLHNENNETHWDY